MDQLETDGNER